METQKIQTGYDYVTEDEYEKTKTYYTFEIKKQDDESTLSWLNRIDKNIKEKLSKLEEQRDEKSYKKFIEAQ